MERIRPQGDERGASSVEYALIAVAIAAVVVVVVFALGGIVRDIFANSCDSIRDHAAPTAATCDS